MPCSMLLFVGGFACGFLVLFLWALRLLPHAARAIPPSHVVTMTVPTLPVEGEWLVFWGGPSAKQNAHHGVGVQHHALDLVKVGDDRTTHRGSGKWTHHRSPAAQRQRQGQYGLPLLGSGHRRGRGWSSRAGGDRHSRCIPR